MTADEAIMALRVFLRFPTVFRSAEEEQVCRLVLDKLEGAGGSLGPGAIALIEDIAERPRTVMPTNGTRP